MRKEKTRFTNRIYRAELGHTSVGSPIVKIVPLNPKGPSASHWQVAAFLYDLAAEMERRSEELATTPQWVTTVETWNDRVILELGTESEAKVADEFIAKLLLDRNLD
jgi:hypothetical protein